MVLRRIREGFLVVIIFSGYLSEVHPLLVTFFPLKKEGFGVRSIDIFKHLCHQL